MWYDIWLRDSENGSLTLVAEGDSEYDDVEYALVVKEEPIVGGGTIWVGSVTWSACSCDGPMHGVVDSVVYATCPEDAIWALTGTIVKVTT